MAILLSNIFDIGEQEMLQYSIIKYMYKYCLPPDEGSTKRGSTSVWEKTNRQTTVTNSLLSWQPAAVAKQVKARARTLVI